MIDWGFRFLILFFDVLVGITWNEQLFSERKRNSNNYLKLTIGAAAALCLCFFKFNNPFSPVLSITLLTVIAGAASLLLRADLRHLIAHTCFYLGIVYLTDMLFLLLLLLIERYLPLPHLLGMGVMIFCKMLFFTSLLRFSKDRNRMQIIKPYYSTIYGTPIAAFIGIALLCNLTFSLDDKKLIYILWVMLSAVLFLRILLTYNWIKYQREKELLSTIAMQKELLENNYAAVNQAYSVNAKVFHDFHKHLEILQQMACKREDYELISYIESISNPLKEISAIVWTGNETVDYIINSRCSQGKESGIAMEMNIEFPYNTNIQSNDLCTILSNLLDNALEACARADDMEQQSIYLAIRRIQNMLIIKLENSSQMPGYNADSELITYKEDHTLHGWGMKNIESAVLKYDGILQTSYADHMFQTIITLSFEGVKLN